MGRSSGACPGNVIMKSQGDKLMQRPKRTPPNNVNFSDRDDYLAREDMSDGPIQMFRFLRTFDNMADGNNPQESEGND